jgi:type I restriction enzyme S subunit
MSKIQIGKLFDIKKGSLQSSKNIDGEYFFITAAEEWKTHTSYSHDCEALVFAAAAEGSLGRVHYVNGKFIASDLCYILTPKKELEKKIDLEFYNYYFKVIREQLVKDCKTGTSKKAINQAKFKSYNILNIDYPEQIELKIKLNKLTILLNETNNLAQIIETLMTSFVTDIL